MRGGDMPTGEILDNGRQTMKLPPAAPQKHPAHDDSCKKRRPAVQMLCYPLRPSNQPINQCFHLTFLRLVAFSSAASEALPSIAAWHQAETPDPVGPINEADSGTDWICTASIRIQDCHLDC